MTRYMWGAILSVLIVDYVARSNSTPGVFSLWYRCKYCEEVQPEYYEAATKLVEKSIPLARIDCEAHKAFCQESGIAVYPTFKVFRGPDDIHTYRGGRKAVE